MLEFFKAQQKATQERIQELYLMKANAGVGTSGDIENEILKQEKLLKEYDDKIKELEGEQTTTDTTSTFENNTASTQPTNPKNHIEKLLAKNKIEEALDVMMDKNIGDRNTVILLMSRVTGIQDKEKEGTINHDNATMEYSRIKSAILQMLKDIV